MFQTKLIIDTGPQDPDTGTVRHRLRIHVGDYLRVVEFPDTPFRTTNEMFDWVGHEVAVVWVELRTKLEGEVEKCVIDNLHILWPDKTDE